RHTSAKRDWSSDVCSADLCNNGSKTRPANGFAGPACPFTSRKIAGNISWRSLMLTHKYIGRLLLGGVLMLAAGVVAAAPMVRFRSEERRVGKEVGAGELRG